MEVPRSFLDDVRSDEWHPDDDHASIESYVEERGRRITAPMIEALSERGVAAEASFVEGDDPAAAIIGAATDLGVDLLVMGATKMIFQGWESVSTRVMAEAEIPVLVVPAPTLEPEDEEA